MENFGLLRLLNSALFSRPAQNEITTAEQGKNPLPVLSRILSAASTAENGEKISADPPPNVSKNSQNGFLDSSASNVSNTSNAAPNAFLSLMERHERTLKKIDASERKKR